MRFRKIYLLVPLTILIMIILGVSASRYIYQTQNVFQVRSIDTAKYSRDLALQELGNNDFNQTIENQVAAIARTGANYVAIDTPYDDKFVPYLQEWVQAARDNNLNVWFKGNFSGWEGWFGYSKIDRSTHQQMMVDFITKNPGLFKDGDIFTPCPECENGGPGDPRQTGDVSGFRSFMVSEYQASEMAFGQINRKVLTNYDSMNLDVAKLVMDRDTTEEMGGVVTVDHYTKEPSQLVEDLDGLAKSSGGQIVLGEFGAPVPDINGPMTDVEQENWINQVMEGLSKDPNVVGVNYWSGFGGSTAIWDDKGSPTKTASVIQKFYNLQKRIPITY